MQRYKLVLGGTVAGIAGVLAFPTTKAHLTVPSASVSSAATSTPSSTATTTKSATGSTESFRYGDIAVKVTVKGTTITKVAVAALDETDGRSAQIDNYAIPQLEQQVISAGSTSIDGVSGATFTSQAFVDAVDSALQKLGIS